MSDVSDVSERRDPGAGRPGAGHPGGGAHGGGFLGVQLRRLRDSKQVRYGGYALLTSLGAVVVLLLINLLVDQLGVEVDLTRNRLFSLSEQTYEVLDALASDVTVYQIATTGRENSMVDAVLERYARRSGHLTLATLDPERNPGLASTYDEEEGSVRPGGLIVDGGERFRLISQFEIFNLNPQTGQPTSLALERELTAALLYVTTGDLPKVYVLTGHGELPLSRLGLPGMSVRDLLDGENYEVETLNLVTHEAVPDDADLLLIVEPQEDLTAQDVERIDSWLLAGGRLVLAVQGARRTELPNLTELLARFGVRIVSGVIVEVAGQHTPDSPAFLLPELVEHEIVAPLRTARLTAVVPAAAPIEELEIKRRTLKVEPFLRTSAEAFLRTDYTIASSEQQEGEPNGPFTIGAAITDNDEDGFPKARLVVISSALFLTQPYRGNYDILLNSLSWARSREESSSIRTKSLFTFPLQISRLAALIISGVAVLVIPLGVLGGGLAMWLRRRHL